MKQFLLTLRDVFRPENMRRGWQKVCVAFRRLTLRKILRRVLQAVLALALIGAILAFIGTESLTESRKAIPQARLTVEDLKAQHNDSLSVAVIYSEDGFAAAAAERLADRCSAVEGVQARAVPELSFYTSSLSYDFEITLGYMSISSGESYLSAYRRIGSGGLELLHKEDSYGNPRRVSILAFAEEHLQRGIEKFASYFFSTGGAFGTMGTVFDTEPSHAEGEVPELLTLAGNTYSSCVVAYPGTDGYSLRALGTLTRQLGPDALVFWGTPDLGIDRGGIADSWQKILQTVEDNASETVMLAVPGAMGSENAGLTLDVLPSLLAEGSGKLREADCRFLLDETGTPVAAEYWLASPKEENIALLSAQMRQYSALLERAAKEPVPQILYLPVIPTEVAAQLPTEYDYVSSTGTVFFDPYTEFVSSSADALFETAVACGVRNFVCNAGYSDVGVVQAQVQSAAISVGFCGSIGFQNPGVGGKFALNNSLRGVLSIVLNPDKDGRMGAEMRYVRAAEYGLTEKNAVEQ